MGQSTHYETLGVAHGDRTQLIRSAYRDLARDCYPDRMTARGTRFYASIRRAFDVLSDSERRSHYDTRADAEVEPLRDAAPDPEPWRLTLMEDFEGTRPSRDEVMHRFRRNFTREGLPKSERADALDLRILLRRRREPTPIDVAFPVFHPCPICHGTGHDGAYPCRHCDHGGVQQTEEVIRIRVPRDWRGVAVCERSLRRAGVRNVVLRMRVCVADG